MSQPSFLPCGAAEGLAGLYGTGSLHFLRCGLVLTLWAAPADPERGGASVEAAPLFRTYEELYLLGEKKGVY